MLEIECIHDILFHAIAVTHLVACGFAFDARWMRARCWRVLSSASKYVATLFQSWLKSHSPAFHDVCNLPRQVHASEVLETECIDDAAISYPLQ